MTLSGVSPAAIPTSYIPAAAKTQSAPAAQPAKPAAPPAAVDSDGDHDGSGRISVKA